MANQATPPTDRNRYQRLDVARLRNLPEVLREGRRFVCWRVEIRDGKPAKVPINPHNGKKAKPNDPSTWGTLAEAVAHYQSHPNDLHGVGRVLAAEDGLTCIDFDDCLDENRNILPSHAAANWVAQLDSWSEISARGTGIHVFMYATPDLDGKMGRNNKAAGVEIYRALHYLTLTGDVLPQFSNQVEYRQAEVEALFREIFGGAEEEVAQEPATEETGARKQGSSAAAADVSPAGKPDLTDEEIIRRARRAKTGRQFEGLWRGQWAPHYPSWSEGDLALCKMLWLQTGNRETVRRLVTLSGLGQRPKWRRKDYQDRTLDRACRGRGSGISEQGTAPTLSEHVELALKLNRASSAAQPKWQSPLFHFARLMKARPELQGLDGLEAAAAIDPVLKALANSSDPWPYHFAHSFDGPVHAGTVKPDPRAEFAQVWPSVKSRALTTPLERAFFQSQRLPLIPTRPVSPDYNRFLSVAGHLQRFMPNAKIALPMVRLGEILGVDRRTVAAYIRLAKRTRALHQVSPWVYARHKATEYRFAVDRFDWTTGQERVEPPTAQEHQNYHQETSRTIKRVHLMAILDVHEKSNPSSELEAVEPKTESVHPQNSPPPDSNSEQNPPPAAHDELSPEEAIAKARARGESLGFSVIFLSAFVERELLLMEKWAAGRRVRGTGAMPESESKGLYSPWGGRFDRVNRARKVNLDRGSLTSGPHP